ncbi:hypothetical protein GCM10023201_57080 [Actinomycetospora corticicola]|uniref:Uncharacterized protein n=1 Tax=Actinomycetospora corticicola TaxID=663602 RepID=A0A7Y9DRV6_9PSEU|nr:hypothetical protein [Actinomycetospora corticicola]NYD34377.1 hypothetical protein [Actinomycetospora corticicola]
MGTGQRMVRRSAGVLAGLVLGGAAVGVGVAHADGIVWGCPSDYSLEGTSCRAADGSTIGALGLVPGDVDPTTGRVLLPLTGSTDAEPPVTVPPVSTPPVTVPPTTTPVTPVTTTPPPTTTPVPPVTTTTPRPASTPVPVPPVRPCSTATSPVTGSSDVTRTAAAVDEARARLAADLRRGASPATISADAQALTAAIKAHAGALAASRAPVVCPVR